MNCVQGDIGDVLKNRDMVRSGDSGYYICCISCAFLWIYWGLFIYRMCENDNQMNSGDMATKFLSKKLENVDDGMMDESQEERETVIGGGGKAYNDNQVYTNNQQDIEQTDKVRTESISIYNDGGIGGGNKPSAGSWQDVEED